MRPDGIALKKTTETKKGLKKEGQRSLKLYRLNDRLSSFKGSFVILEFKRMSDVTYEYIERVRQTAEAQYVSLRRICVRTAIQCPASRYRYHSIEASHEDV